MLTLTPAQEDALIEIGNVGMSKAAKQLAVLLNSTIKISIPKISLVNINDMAADSCYDKQQILSFVYQTLSGDIQGCASLVFLREQTTLLTMAVIGETPQLTQEEARAWEQEAMLEIGNIIISSCMSVIVNMLSMSIQLSLPSYDENDIVSLLQKLCQPIKGSTDTIIALSTKFDLSNDKLSGSLFIILTEESVLSLLQGVQELLGE